MHFPSFLSPSVLETKLRTSYTYVTESALVTAGQHQVFPVCFFSSRFFLFITSYRIRRETRGQWMSKTVPSRTFLQTCCTPPYPTGIESGLLNPQCVSSKLPHATSPNPKFSTDRIISANHLIVMSDLNRHVIIHSLVTIRLHESVQGTLENLSTQPIRSAPWKAWGGACCLQLRTLETVCSGGGG